MKEVKYLGFVVNSEGCKPDSEKINKLAKLPNPTNRDELRRALGLFGYYRSFIPNFALLSAPLTHLMSKTVSWEWGEKHLESLNKLKKCMENIVMNYHFDQEAPTVLDTGYRCSECSNGAILQQGKDGRLLPVAMASNKFSKTEQNWSTREREAYAVVWVIQKFRRLLLGRHFVVRSDHSLLQWLKNAEQPKLVRWVILLSEFDFVIMYNRGKDMEHVDCLSRATYMDEAEAALVEKAVLSLETISLEPKAIDTFRGLQEKDPQLKQLRGNHKCILNEDGVWTFDGKIWVPQDLRNDLLIQDLRNDFFHHYAPWGAHASKGKTMKKLALKYVWPGLVKDVLL